MQQTIILEEPQTTPRLKRSSISRAKKSYWKHRQEILEKKKVHYSKNKEKELLRVKTFYHKNKERILYKQRNHYYANRERVLAKAMRYNQLHQENINLKARTFYAANRERICTNQRIKYHELKNLFKFWKSPHTFCTLMKIKYWAQPTPHDLRKSHNHIKRTWAKQRLWLGGRAGLLIKANHSARIQQINEKLFPPYTSQEPLPLE